MTPTRIACLLFLALLQTGCSRPSDSSDSAATQKHAEKHGRAATNISEEQAAALLRSKLEASRIRDLDCLAFQDESGAPAGSKAEQWEFAARERHDERCGGDPGVFPVRDRYRISSSGEVWVYDAVNGEYTQLRGMR